jgi:hypothetical protein
VAFGACARCSRGHRLGGRLITVAALCERRIKKNRQFSTDVSEKRICLALICHLIIFRSKLKIAQRFNAGHYAFPFVESHRTTESFFRPSRDSIFTSLPNRALKRWAIVKLVPPLPRRIRASETAPQAGSRAATLNRYGETSAPFLQGKPLASHETLTASPTD